MEATLRLPAACVKEISNYLRGPLGPKDACVQEPKPRASCVSSRKEGAAPGHQVLVDLRLDGLAHLLRDVEDQAAVVGGLGWVLGKIDRLAELDPPLRGQRHETERP